MAERPPERSWFGPAAPWPSAIQGDDTREFSRIWQGFMTARFTVALVLLALQVTLAAIGGAHGKWLIAISLAYFASTLTTGLFGRPLFLGNSFNRHWLRLVGLDVLALSSLQVLQGSAVNYTPLFALPILLAAVLGSLRLALGTAAGVTVLLLGSALHSYVDGASDARVSLLQAALSGAGYFAIALLANQLSSRLSSEGLRVRSSQAAANLQRQVNELVIELLPDGVLIVDRLGAVRAANPAAQELLAAGGSSERLLDLHQSPAFLPLLELALRSLASGQGLQDELSIRHVGQGPRRIRASSRPTDPQDLGGESLCVLFLQDQRQLEARLRTEKLASMGRMSTAVAHEIRNPLAAISQANALLEEDLPDARHRRLTQMVGQNAQRLAKIVNDILNASRAQPQEGDGAPLMVALDATVARICADWAEQNQCPQRLLCAPAAPQLAVRFEGEHLRRVLFNLLDNALRYAQGGPAGIQVHTALQAGQATLEVWSAGAPMDQSVERHLFEPFFSSESRSSGLGLYICRELCEGHGASIAYQRASRSVDGQEREGNAFVVAFSMPLAQAPNAPDAAPAPPWPTPTP